jgi:DNA helicase TIP49 (TBP-interacting protein)
MELSGSCKLERIGMHSHIKGLGVDMATLKVYDACDEVENLHPEEEGRCEGMVGQLRARKAAALLVSMLASGHKKSVESGQKMTENKEEQNSVKNTSSAFHANSTAIHANALSAASTPAGSFGGRGVLLTGPPGTGKTALAMGKLSVLSSCYLSRLLI